MGELDEVKSGTLLGGMVLTGNYFFLFFIFYFILFFGRGGEGGGA